MPLAAVAGIGAIGSIIGGVVGSNAAGNAASTQAAAANHAADLQSQAAKDALNFNKLQYGNSLNLLSPYYNTGVSANNRLASLMGLRPNQGLPPGVINPNAPQGQVGGGVPGSGVGNGFVPGIGPVPSNATGNGSRFQPFQADGNTPQLNGLNRFGVLADNAAGTQQFTMNPPITSGGTNGTQFQMNPPITSGGTQSGPNGVMTPSGQPGGAAGMLGANGQPLPEFNPGTLNLNGGTPTPLGDQAGPPNLGNLGNGTQTADGGSGQVPRTDGGTPGPDGSTMLGDGGIEQQLFGPGGGFGSGGGPNDGSFGSLATGWNQTFQSPNSVTEQNDPGYQFRLQQGQQALQNSAAARGGLLSGGTAKALTDYNQNAASGEYGNVYNRALQNYNTNYNTFTNDQTNTFNRLAALSGQGQVSANNLSASGITAAGNAANIGLTSAGQIGQNINNAGAANASGYINSANAINGAIGGASNSLSTLALLKQLQQGSGGNSSAGYGVY